MFIDLNSFLKWAMWPMNLLSLFSCREFQGRTAVGIRGALRGRGRGAAGSRGAGNQRTTFVPGLMGRGLRRYPQEVSWMLKKSAWDSCSVFHISCISKSFWNYVIFSYSFASLVRIRFSLNVKEIFCFFDLLWGIRSNTAGLNWTWHVNTIAVNNVSSDIS